MWGDPHARMLGGSGGRPDQTGLSAACGRRDPKGQGNMPVERVSEGEEETLTMEEESPHPASGIKRTWVIITGEPTRNVRPKIHPLSFI